MTKTRKVESLDARLPCRCGRCRGAKESGDGTQSESRSNCEVAVIRAPFSFDK